MLQTALDPLLYLLIDFGTMFPAYPCQDAKYMIHRVNNYMSKDVSSLACMGFADPSEC